MTKTDTNHLSQVVENVTLLVDEIKLINMNLTIANARLRLTDNAFQAVGGSFRQLIDITAETQEAAEILLKRTRGETLSDEEQEFMKREPDYNLERIQKAAESIIQTVMAIKKGSPINRQA